MSFYAVKEGHKVGVYTSWTDCQKQIEGYPNARYKKFEDMEKAVCFVGRNQVTIYGFTGVGSEHKNENELVELKDEKNLKDGEAVAYVDGSFDLDSFTYSYGVVYFTKDGKRTYSGREDDEDLAKMRNVSGELRAAMEAMEKACEEGMDSLYLHYDYKGIEEWALGRWKTNKEGTKRYKEFYDSLNKELDVVFIKVPAHTGIRYNEEADRLAKEAL